MLQIVGVIIFILIKYAFEQAKKDVRSSSRTNSSYTSFKRTTLNVDDDFNTDVNRGTAAAFTNYKRTTLNEVKKEMKVFEYDDEEEIEDIDDILEELDQTVEETEDTSLEIPILSPVEPLTIEDTIIKEEAPIEVKKESSPINRMKLMLIMLIYVMYEDDGEFTRKEKRVVQTVIKVVSRPFASKETDELEALLELRPNLDYIVDRVEEYNISAEEVFSMVKELRKTVKKNNNYESIFERIENRMQYEI